MPEIVISGIPIQFPFDPYPVQHDYMAKVIECLQTNVNGALESPTGTGKTLCLLCATLGWLEYKKASLQADYTSITTQGAQGAGFAAAFGGFTKDGASSANPGGATAEGAGWGGITGSPKIIYASRTHSQLSQAVAELKRTKYKYMKVAVLGSRDQLCIHPEVSKELNNNTKLHMCQIRVKSKTCYFHNQVEGKKDDPYLKSEVLDLEDLVKYGRRRTCCPYYLSRDLRLEADIIFMPYNYLLDPKTRRAHGIELQGYVVILDEAHNVEKICEESASLQLRSTDIALCIDEVTQVMQKLQESGGDHESFAANDPDAGPQDFQIEDLYILKTLFLQFEEAVDALPVTSEGQSHPGSFMFDLLEKAEITPAKKPIICDLLDKLVQYLTNNSNSPFQRKGAGLQKFSDLVKIVFSKDNFTIAHMESIKRSYKVHVAIEEPKKRGGGGWGGGNSGNNRGDETGGNNKQSGWGGGGGGGNNSWGGGGGNNSWGGGGGNNSWGGGGGNNSWGGGGGGGGGGNNKGGGGGGGGGWAGFGGKATGGGTKEQTNTLTSKKGRVLSYWCFNPGFGMRELVEQGLRSLLITSGTLSPLQSFTEELQVGFPVTLENPHIIQGHQVMVSVVSRGPDGHMLNSSYQNRTRPEYLNSLGNLVLNFSRVIPGGLLVFFPSYPIMRSCHEHWQIKGIWDRIVGLKPAFVEPQGKDGFTATMQEFYEKVNDPALRGAIFMAVCRGKVSEGLDFADGNGRAVVITGLPYPPYKDPRVVLKRQYLDTNFSKEKRGLTGQAWYRLEASRAVNQAIGRVIRHKDDYGAILLADHRFGDGGFAQQLSKWVQPYLKVYKEFGPIMRDLTRFFRAALTQLPQPTSRNKYLKKDCDGDGSVPLTAAKYEPLPGAPVPSSGLSQAPSRLIARYSSHTTSSMEGPADLSLFGPSSNGGLSGEGQTLASRAMKSANNVCQWESAKTENGTGGSPKSLMDSLHGDQDIKKENIGASNTSASVTSNPINFNTLSNNKRLRTETQQTKLNFSNLSSSQQTSPGQKSNYEDLTSVANRRKKIKVTANVSSNDQSKAPGNSEASATSKASGTLPDTMKTISRYVLEVKACLGAEEYKEFSASVKLYQTKRDYDSVLLVLLRIFKDKEKQHLLKRFSTFLSREHREKFLAHSDVSSS